MFQFTRRLLHTRILWLKKEYLEFGPPNIVQYNNNKQKMLKNILNTNNLSTNDIKIIKKFINSKDANVLIWHNLKHLYVINQACEVLFTIRNDKGTDLKDKVYTLRL